MSDKLLELAMRKAGVTGDDYRIASWSGLPEHEEGKKWVPTHALIELIRAPLESGLLAGVTPDIDWSRADEKSRAYAVLTMAEYSEATKEA